ncbi:hypothetical protein KUCAC02_028648, partial [Chaenocephalus aceratus]
FPPPLSRDGVEGDGVCVSGWRADVLLGKHEGCCAKASHSQIRNAGIGSSHHRRGIQASPLICPTESRPLAGHAFFIKKTGVSDARHLSLSPISACHLPAQVVISSRHVEGRVRLNDKVPSRPLRAHDSPHFGGHTSSRRARNADKKAHVDLCCGFDPELTEET